MPATTRPDLRKHPARACPFCGSMKTYHNRPAVYRCKACRKYFSTRKKWAKNEGNRRWRALGTQGTFTEQWFGSPAKLIAACDRWNDAEHRERLRGMGY